MTSASPVPDEPQFPLFHDYPSAMSPDTRLLCVVVTRLQQDPLVRAEHLCVEVQNAVVILTGLVTSPAVAAAATDHAWRTPGVHDVSNQLRCLDNPLA